MDGRQQRRWARHPLPESYERSFVGAVGLVRANPGERFTLLELVVFLEDDLV